jgi:hypothetical protein
MENFLHQQNLALFNKRLAERHTDEEREVIMKLLTDEQAKRTTADKWHCQVAFDSAASNRR